MEGTAQPSRNAPARQAYCAGLDAAGGLRYCWGMVEISKAAPGDFLAIAALDREAWKGNAHAEHIPDGEHVWRIWCEHALVHKAEERGEVVGAILAFPCVGGGWCVHKVFTAHGSRGRGIGSSLFERLLRELDALGADSFLTVDPANEAAQALYARWGYAERAFVKGFYRDCEDRWVLTRRAARP